uniref:Chromo domain-containing protein n=1 Tax=Ananas comosus var. bracteatus TaxID=296719 RepID=A0A6V7P9R6_ANACO|nr:unnamed protein product [Ananas comosus var. bracteatus]
MFARAVLRSLWGRVGQTHSSSGNVGLPQALRRHKPDYLGHMAGLGTHRLGLRRVSGRNTWSETFWGPREIESSICRTVRGIRAHWRGGVQDCIATETRGVHDVFHVSNLRKYIRNSTHVLEYEPVELHEDMSYEEYPVCILSREERKLRSRKIPFVKVQWSNHAVREATWELEETMRRMHPHLFESTS